MATDDFHPFFIHSLLLFSSFGFSQKVEEKKTKHIQQSKSAREQNEMTLKFSICTETCKKKIEQKTVSNDFWIETTHSNWCKQKMIFLHCESLRTTNLRDWVCASVFLVSIWFWHWSVGSLPFDLLLMNGFSVGWQFFSNSFFPAIL